MNIKVLDDINENIYKSIIDFCKFSMYFYNKQFNFKFEYIPIKSKL